MLDKRCWEVLVAPSRYELVRRKTATFLTKIRKQPPTNPLVMPSRAYAKIV